MKASYKRVVNAKIIQGADQMKRTPYENGGVMNNRTRKGGFSSSQWALGKFRRRPGDLQGEDELANLRALPERFVGQ